HKLNNIDSLPYHQTHTSFCLSSKIVVWMDLHMLELILCQYILELHCVLFQTGTVWTNCWLLRDLNMPFGGIKASGIGREGAKESAEFFTELKTIVIAVD
ncbi:unnamed protein product, partial [Owenia fusiformis]